MGPSVAAVLLPLCLALAHDPDEALGLAVAARELRGDTLEVSVVLPPTGAPDEALVEALYRRFLGELAPDQQLRVYALDAAGLRVPIESLLPYIPPPPEKTYARDEAGTAPRRDPASSPGLQIPSSNPGQQGFLAGKTVFLSPGHGWFHEPPASRWETQRGVTNGIVEDLGNIDAVTQFLLLYLENAGADVWMVRERDRNPSQVIVDNGELDPANGSYAELGAASQFINSTLIGYGHVPLPYNGSQNPLKQGSMRLMALSSGVATASVRWTPNVPADGDYAVYASFGPFTNRPRDAHYRVQHRAGVSDLRIDQTRDGFTWRFLGTFPFRAGHHPGTQEVVLLNDTSDPLASFASLDAIRFGGGLGDIDRGDGVSGKVRYDECARYYTQYTGAPATVYQSSTSDRTSDITARSRYAAYENEPGEDSIYFAWHTNAPDPGTGTSSFVYTPNPAAGSTLLQSLTHDEVIADLRAGYDLAWVDRGKLSAAFGEVNPAHNPEMPSVLMEIAFHDTPSDALRLRDARFLAVCGRAIAQGIARYFAQKDGVPVRLFPEPPVQLRATALSAETALVAWEAPAAGPAGLFGDPPQGYRVEISGDGRSFGELAVETRRKSAVIAGLRPGRPAFVRVVALNAGGRSLPTPTLAVLTQPLGGPIEPASGGGPRRALFVQGFTRTGPFLLPDLSQPVSGTLPVTAGASGTLIVKRYRREEVNSYDYAVEHANAIARVGGVALDATTREAFAAGQVDLSLYELVVWQAGEQAEVYSGDGVDDTSFVPAERARIAQFLGAGGRLLLSGAEVAFDLDRDSDLLDAESLFVRNWLKAAYVSDDANTFTVKGIGALAALGTFSFDDGSGPAYAVEFPERLAPFGGSSSVLLYQGGLGGNAATLFQGDFRVLYLGFPFETVGGETTRAALMQSALQLLLGG